MIRLLQSELVKMWTTRSTKLVIAAAVLLPLVVHLLVVTFAFSSGRMNDSVVFMVASSAPLVSLLLGVLGVLCSTQEYSQGTIRITLVATPHRFQVFVAKVMTMVSISIAAVTALILGVMVPAPFILNARGINFELIGNDARGIPSFFLLAGLMSVLGLSLGLIFRSAPGAISSILIWPTIVEGLIIGGLSAAINKDLFRWAPIQNGFELISKSTNADQNSWPVALVYFGSFVLVFVVLGAALFQRRDA